ncbi:unnamed protein product [Zymoseptoria tritici ST99CH_3D1]|nr:unnamed protein product [Zymoseptoria tritici ST99CH_3D1]
MSHTATLLGMPPELFDNIANSTHWKDLGSLRLVSRECAMKVSSVYKVDHFRIRRVKIATETSITNAINIVDHPEFGAAIRELLLIDDAASDPFDFSWEDAENPEKGAKDLRKAMAQYNAQQSTMKSGSGRRLLTGLFGKCVKKGIKTLQYSSWNEGCWNYDGEWSLRSTEDIVEWQGATNDHCFMTVMLAIVSSGVSFETFKMNTGNGAGIPICTYGTDFQKGAICKAALSNFEALDLALCASEDDEGTGYQTALEFLTMMTQLKIRSLEVTALQHAHGDQRSPLTAFMELNFPAMKLLRLGHARLDLEDLVVYLKRQKSLRELDISGCIVCFNPRMSDSEKHRFMQGLENLKVIRRNVSLHAKLD